NRTPKKAGSAPALWAYRCTEAESEQADHSQVQPCPAYRSQHLRLRERRARLNAGHMRMRGGEDGLPDAERGEAHHLPDHERAGSEDDCLRGQHSSSLRHGGERGPDHAGAVLGADHQNAEGAYRDLGQVNAAEAGQGGIETVDLSRVGIGDELRPADADDCPEADGEERGEDGRPVGRTHRSQLCPLREEQVAEADCRGRWPLGRRRNDSAGHDAPTSTRKSTLSPVSSRYAASKEASRGDNSCTAMPCSAARSPISGPVRPLTSNAPSDACTDIPPDPRTNASNRARCGVRTST